jgi:hypothetical protein
MGYIHHQRSRMDRRSVRVSLSDKGLDIARIVNGLYDRHIRSIEQAGGIGTGDFKELNRSLQRLERFWTDQILLPALTVAKRLDRPGRVPGPDCGSATEAEK